MRRMLLLLFIMISMVGFVACSIKDPIATKDITPTPYPTNAIITPTVINEEIPQNEYEVVENTNNILPTPVFNERELLLTEDDKHKLGILIKWIYNDNISYLGEDANEIQLPDKLELLTTDRNKINFVINVVVFEDIMNSVREDMIYSFKAEDADMLIESAIGDKFDEHNSNEVEYQDGIYYYSIVGADGAMWWPDIEINKVTAISEEKARVEGVLMNRHDIYTKVYSYDFEAVVSINRDSPFGGFTLEELDILSEIVTDTARTNTEEQIERKPTQEPPTTQLNNNLCAANEEVLICFPFADSKKLLSICIEKSQQEYIVYRFGTKEKIELEYPDDKADSWSKFIYSYYLRAGGSENEGLDLNYLTFESSGYSYKIYQEYSAESDETKVGIMVTNLSTSEEIQNEGSTDGLVGNLINLRDNDNITIEY